MIMKVNGSEIQCNVMDRDIAANLNKGETVKFNGTVEKFGLFDQLILTDCSFEKAINIPPERNKSHEQKSEGPSFDCLRAKLMVEKLICSDKELSKLDIDLSTIYNNLKNQAENKNKIKSDQLNWLKNKRNICSDSECIKTAYKERFNELK